MGTMASVRSWRMLLAAMLVVLLSHGRAAAAADTAQLPSCALSCLVQTISQTPCSLLNTTCICTNAELTTLMTACVASNCTVKESLTTRNATAITCNEPVRDRSASARAAAIATGVVGGLVVILRCGYQIGFATWSGTGFLNMGLDDWAMLATGILGVPQVVIVVHGTIPNGLGRDVWTLPVDNNNQTIYRFGRYIYILEIFYFCSLMMLKVTLLLFYERIFAPDRRVRWLLRGTVAFVVGASMLFVLLGIAQCQPVSYFWTGWDGVHTGRCVFNTNVLAWAHAAFSIATDAWMLAIPLSQLRHLKLHWRKKIGVALMFCMGTFVTIVSILRLQSLVSFTASTNPTWSNADVSYWSTIEIGVGTVCACMPSLRLILVRISPRIFGGSSARHYAYSDDNYWRSNNNNNNNNNNTNNSRSQPSRNTNRSRPRSIPLTVPSNKTPTHTTVSANGRIDLDPETKSSVTAVPPAVLPHARSKNPSHIVYTQSYAVEYGAKTSDHSLYHDQARLVQNHPVPVHTEASSSTIPSSRGSNTSVESK